MFPVQSERPRYRTCKGDPYHPLWVPQAKKRVMTQDMLAPIPRDRSPSGDVYSHPPPEMGWDPESEGLNETFDWRKPLVALIRYKWVVILSALLGSGAAYAVWNWIQPEYVAQGSLWVQTEASSDRGPIVTGGLLESQSWVDLLLSYAVLDSVVYQERLYLTTERPQHLSLFDSFGLDERFAPGAYRLRTSDDGRVMELLRDRSTVDRAAPGEPLGADLGFRWRVPEEGFPAGEEIGFSIVTPRDAARQLRQGLMTHMALQGSFISVELADQNPVRASRTLNGVMERYVTVAADLKRGNLDEQTQTLARQLQQVALELQEAERSLEAFRVQTVTLPSEERMAIQPGLEMTRGPVFDEFFSLRIEQDNRRRDIRRLEAALSGSADGEFPVEAVELVPAVMNSSQLQEALVALVAARSERRELMNRYTSEHPQVQEVSQRIHILEMERLPGLVSRLLSQLRQEEAALEQRIVASGVDLSDIPPRAIEEARLRRQVDIAESLYTDLRSRYEAATLAQGSSVPDVRILDRATPPDIPSHDRRILMAGAAFLAFLGAGVAATLLLDRLDSRIRTPDEAARAVGFAVLGAVPRLRWTNGRKGTENVNQVYEAFRELRTNLEYAYGSAGPVTFAITSPAASEGKTLVTTNLGIAFAGLGRRTLIIDGDTRRGDLHHYLEGRRKPGLTDFLRSTASVREIVQGTPYQGLHFIGSGTHVPNSPELLASGRMGKLLGEVRGDFDVVIVDTPPLGAGADSMVLGALAGHLTVVVRSGSTDRELTMAKLEPLHRLPIRVLGVVLNDFVPDRLSSYYKYYGSYLPDYEAGLEDEGEIDPTGGSPRRIVGVGSEASED